MKQSRFLVRSLSNLLPPRLSWYLSFALLRCSRPRVLTFDSHHISILHSRIHLIDGSTTTITSYNEQSSSSILSSPLPVTGRFRTTFTNLLQPSNGIPPSFL